MIVTNENRQTMKQVQKGAAKPLVPLFTKQNNPPRARLLALEVLNWLQRDRRGWGWVILGNEARRGRQRQQII
jgi:hypothetical protein